LIKYQKNVKKIFKNNYDNEMNDPDQVERDLSEITMIPQVQASKGKKCEPGQYARVHWTAELKSNGQLVQDTR
jgi:hypothetical protein